MTWHIDIERIAGILEGQARLEPGMNAVRGSNWQGKSSFIEAIKTGLGVATTLTEGAQEGAVSLDTPSGEFAVTLRREDGAVEWTGTPYVTDEYDRTRVELFACLDEANPVRRAVRQGENLQEVLLRPLALQNIDEQIATRKHEREQVESELSQAKDAQKRLPTVTESVTSLEDELETLRAKRAELSTTAADAAAPRRDLREARTEKTDADEQVDRLSRSIERIEARLSDRRTEVDDLAVPADGEVAEELADAREDLTALQRDVEVLQSVYAATERVLDEGRLDLITDVSREIDGDDVTCFTCGSTVSQADLESQLSALGEQLSTLRAQQEQLRERVEELEARREERTQARRRQETLEREVAELEESLAEKRTSLAAAKDRRDAAAERVETLAARVDDTVEAISDIESEIKYREAELTDAREDLDQLQARAERVEALQAEYDEIHEEIVALRDRKDRVTRETRAAFEAAMDDILDRFDIGFESARLTGDFRITVARDGRATTLDALSEGEVELIGFVAALAGRATFNVDELLPLLLVDDLGGLADDSLHTLLSYLEGQTEYLVFTAYPEYTAFDGREISPGEWTVTQGDTAHAD
jgi:chromosome segregation ATPase